MKVENNEMDIIFLLDRSGSMYGSEKDTIGGFNSLIKQYKKDEINARVTTVLFDHEYNMLYKRKSIWDINDLTENEYNVRGTTSLLDAIGKTILTMQKKVNGKVLFVITTDGYENSSKEFTKTQIKNMISNHNWEFIFLGADIDSYSEATQIGIKKSHTANYNKSSKGITDMYESVKDLSLCIYEEREIDEKWKEKLEE